MVVCLDRLATDEPLFSYGFRVFVGPESDASPAHYPD